MKVVRKIQLGHRVRLHPSERWNHCLFLQLGGIVAVSSLSSEVCCISLKDHELGLDLVFCFLVPRAGMESVQGTAAISVIANRKKRPVPIVPSTLAEHEPDYQPDQPTAPNCFETKPSRMPLGLLCETALPASKRQKRSSDKKLPGQVPNKSGWVMPEVLRKKGSRPPIFANVSLINFTLVSGLNSILTRRIYIRLA